MPRTLVLLYAEADQTCPILEWLDGLPAKARSKCVVRLERLAELGHELRRPEADLLRDDIHELRIGLQGIHYRILYFFHGRDVAVLSHGVIKESAVPPREIDLAVRRKAAFMADPDGHTYKE